MHAVRGNLQWSFYLKYVSTPKPLAPINDHNFERRQTRISIQTQLQNPLFWRTPSDRAHLFHDFVKQVLIVDFLYFSICSMSLEISLLFLLLFYFFYFFFFFFFLSLQYFLIFDFLILIFFQFSFLYIFNFEFFEIVLIFFYMLLAACRPMSLAEKLGSSQKTGALEEGKV